MNLLRRHMMDIDEQLAELKSLLFNTGDGENAIFFDIPLVTKEMEQSIIDNDYDVLPISVIKGEEAKTRIIASYADMYVQDEKFSRRFVHKFPGLLPLDIDPKVIQKLLERLNASKAEFKSEVQKFEDKREKWAEVHDRFNYLITTTAYRKVYGYYGDYMAFYFNWARRPRTETKDAKHWVEQLERSKSRGMRGFTDKAWQEKVDQEIDIVMQNAHRKLVSRRPIKLRPECTWRDKEKKMSTDSAGLPFLLAGHKNLPKVTHLKDYVKKDAPVKDGKRELILPRLYLYAV